MLKVIFSLGCHFRKGAISPPVNMFDPSNFSEANHECIIVAPNRSIASALNKQEITKSDVHDLSFDLGYEEKILNPIETLQKNKFSLLEGILDISIKKSMIITEDSEHYLALDLKVENRSSLDIKEFSIDKMIKSKTLY